MSRQIGGVMAEWLRRQTRNLVGSALVGSNPADVDLSFIELLPNQYPFIFFKILCFSYLA